MNLAVRQEVEMNHPKTTRGPVRGHRATQVTDGAEILITEGGSKSVAERAVETGLFILGYGFEPKPGTLLDLASFPFRLTFEDGSTLLVERVAMVFADDPLLKAGQPN
jgi:hypothetical protein